MSATTFRVTRSGIPLPVALGYDAGTRTATAVVPLLPGVAYQAEVTSGVAAPDGTRLDTTLAWSFTTRAWQGTTADAADGGEFPSLALDGSGRLHVSHYDWLGLNLRYATCDADCATAAGWTAAEVDAAGNRGAFSALAVEPTGRVHVVSYDQTLSELRYATCAATCSVPGNWQTAVAVGGGVGSYASLARDAGGRLHVAFYDEIADDLRYASCAGSCTLAASWDTVTVDSAGNVGWYTSIGVDGAGSVHISYYDVDGGHLKYATCGGACTAAASWEAVTVDAAATVGFGTSLAVRGTEVRVAYYDFANGDLKYAACAASCTSGASWQTVTVDAVGSVGENPALALDAAGRAHVSYYDSDNGTLRYATCAASCLVTASWQSGAPDPAGHGGTYNAIVVDDAGRVHVAYFDVTAGRLRYLE